MNVLIENSTWNNIGDAFYQWPLQDVFTSWFGRDAVASADGPLVRAFRPKGRFARNAYDIAKYQRADLHVFSGPILKRLTTTDYRPTIESLAAKGEKYALLSCSSAESTPADLEATRAMLKRYPPVAFSTRDPQTYEHFKDYVPSAYNGVCFAFLVRDLPVGRFEADKPFIVSSFYRDPEPVYRLPSPDAPATEIEASERKNLLGLPWRASRHIDWLRTYPDKIGPYEIVRTHQSISYRFSHLNFPAPRTFISFNPTSYFSIYRATEMTVSDRVHACVATLSLGKPAKLLYRGERCGLFDRFDLPWRDGGVMRLDAARIEQEKQAMFDYVRSALNDAGLKC